MYAIEIAPEFSNQTEHLHPKRFKAIHLQIFALQKNPRPPDSVMMDPERYFIRVGPYKIAYTIDDGRRRVKVYALEEKKDE
jgi:mRNA-degrading endonuclease RelE of RelBE toxin-antitoxin system